jgi:hypothetical protein
MFFAVLCCSATLVVQRPLLFTMFSYTRVVQRPLLMSTLLLLSHLPCLKTFVVRQLLLCSNLVFNKMLSLSYNPYVSQFLLFVHCRSQPISLTQQPLLFHQHQQGATEWPSLLVHCFCLWGVACCLNILQRGEGGGGGGAQW